MEDATRPQTYGIHFLKAVAIIFQVYVHAYFWSLMVFPGSLGSASPLALKASLLIGTLSMTIPATALAIMRVSLGDRLPAPRDFSWRPYIDIAVALALLESIKGVLNDDWSDFFQWNALHLIAVAIIVTVFALRHSKWLLWLVSSLTVFGAAFLFGPLDRADTATEHWLYSQPLVPWLIKLAYFFLLSLIFFAVFRAWLRRWKVEKVGKLWLLYIAIEVILALTLIPLNKVWAAQTNLALLWIGILAGTKGGQHIWGLFPWLGVTLLGFLVYDWIIQFRASWKLSVVLGLLGALMITAFYLTSAGAVSAACSPLGHRSGFNGICFNRTPMQALLVVGLFTVLAAFAPNAEKWGWETQFCRMLSRSILWIYLFETSVLDHIAYWWVKLIPGAAAIPTFVIFSLLASFLLAYIINKMPTRIELTLRKANVQ